MSSWARAEKGKTAQVNARNTNAGAAGSGDRIRGPLVMATDAAARGLEPCPDGLDQNALVFLKILCQCLFPQQRCRSSFGARLEDFVMHQPLPHQTNVEIRILDLPNLPVLQWGWRNSALQSGWGNSARSNHALSDTQLIRVFNLDRNNPVSVPFFLPAAAHPQPIDRGWKTIPGTGRFSNLKKMVGAVRFELTTF